jgi:hypothetical protein
MLAADPVKTFQPVTVAVKTKIYVKTNGSILQKSFCDFFSLVTLMHFSCQKGGVHFGRSSIAKTSSKVLADVFF